MRVTALVLGVLVLAGTARAQQVSINSSGDYSTDLGQVYGAIRGAKMLEEICSKHFPSDADAHARAYKGWRARYLPFIQEIERHFTGLMWSESKDDPALYTRERRKTEEYLLTIKGTMESDLLRDGGTTLRNSCSQLPAYFTSPRMDLERYYPEQVTVIRASPEGR